MCSLVTVEFWLWNLLSSKARLESWLCYLLTDTKQFIDSLLSFLIFKMEKMSTSQVCDKGKHVLNKMLYKYKEISFIWLAKGPEEWKKLFLIFRLEKRGFWQWGMIVKAVAAAVWSTLLDNLDIDCIHLIRLALKTFVLLYNLHAFSKDFKYSVKQSARHHSKCQEESYLIPVLKKFSF